MSADVEVANPPNDSVSGLAFSPQADFLAVSSWDKKVRIYEIEPSGNSIPRAAYDHTKPALCVAWNKTGTQVVSGDGDGVALVYDIAAQKAIPLGQHDDGIRCIKFLENEPFIVATGSWDKTIRYWDTRTQKQVAILQLPDRCFAMDTAVDRRGNEWLVAGTADRHIVIVDLQKPSEIKKDKNSPLKWQTRTVACHTDGMGYAVGSIEGRVAIEYFDFDYFQQENKGKPQFMFKCYEHQTRPMNFCNAIRFHPNIPGTFVTANNDGSYCTWDKDNKTKLERYYTERGSITCTAFNRNGTILAYANSDDGASPTGKYTGAKIFLHPLSELDYKPRPKNMFNK